MKLTSIRKKSSAYAKSSVFAKATPDKTADRSVSRPHSAFRIPHSQGFTLIELMMVVLVILLLSGLLFRLGTIIKDRSERARALADIENISNAIEEYYAVYGQYPPTTGMKYEYQDRSLWSPPMQNTEIPLEMNHVYGLVSYLYDRGGDDPLKSADQNAVNDQWQHLLADVGKSSGTGGYELDEDVIGGVQNYSNRVENIKDPWGAAYNYKSIPPYLSYRLWSSNLD